MQSFDTKKPMKSIPEIFEGKSVFITGGSGFIGKVLIEKLLRTCPGLKNIYILMRPKKNILCIQERITAFMNVPLFDQLKADNGEILRKVIGVAGDIAQLNLGLNDEDIKTIIDNVSIIYHMAASVRFDDPLKKAILSNTRSTRDIISLAKRCKTLDVFVHCSTAYSNFDQDVIEEKVYAPDQDWRMAIELAEKYDEMVLQVLTEKVIYPLPNTYTYAKKLAEQVVIDLCTNQIPTIIMRPSIVLPTYIDPFGGWIDNFNGPTVFTLFAGMGLLKIIYTDKHVEYDQVFVDNTVKVLIIAAGKKSVMSNTSVIEVHNIASDANFDDTFLQTIGTRAVTENPSKHFLWSAIPSCTNNRFAFYIMFIIYHMVPALILDSIASLSGNKPRLIKLYRKFFIANISMEPFMMKKVNFRTDNYLALEEYITECEKESLSFINSRMTGNSKKLSKVMQIIWRGMKQNLLKEKPYATEAETKRYLRIMKFQKMFFFAVKGWIAYLVISKFLLPPFISEIDKIFTE